MTRRKDDDCAVVQLSAWFTALSCRHDTASRGREPRILICDSVRLRSRRAQEGEVATYSITLLMVVNEHVVNEHVLFCWPTSSLRARAFHVVTVVPEQNFTATASIGSFAAFPEPIRQLCTERQRFT